MRTTITTQVPNDVAQWIDEKVKVAGSSRSKVVGDTLIELHRRDQEAQAHKRIPIAVNCEEPTKEGVENDEKET